MSAFERAVDGTDDIVTGDDYRALQVDRDRLAAELAACRRVLAHLDPVLLDSLSIALAEEGDNNHALQLTAAARELRALDKED